MYKTYLILFFILYAQFSFSQEYEKIDSYLTENSLKKNASTESLNILLSTVDCEKCISYMHGFLQQSGGQSLYDVNIITDNKAYAKKILLDYPEVKYNLYFDKNVFSNYLNLKSGIYYKDMSKRVIADEKGIKTKIQNAINRQEYFQSFDDKKIILLQDSLLAQFPNLITTVLPENTLFIFDNKMDQALVLDLEINQNSITAKNKTYKAPQTSKPTKLFPLPTNDSLEKNLVTFDKNNEILKSINAKMIKIYSVNYWNNIAYTVFRITRAYDFNGKSSIITHSYLATKKINGNIPIEDLTNQLLDISTYNSYFPIDRFPKDSSMVYQLSGGIYFKPQIVDDNLISMRVQEQSNVIEGKLSYGGMATIKLQPPIPHILKTDNEFDEFLNLNSIFELNGKTYQLYKNLTNEEENTGDILIKEFNSNFINRYREKIKAL